MPNVILKKLVGSIAIGCGCLLVGIVSIAAYHDIKMFMLSLVITAGLFIKGFLICKQFKSGNYITITGNCIKISRTLFVKYKTVYVETAEDTIELYLPKDVKISTNETYVFYFKKKPSETTMIINNYITSRLNTDNFLGCERCIISDEKEE